MRARNAVWWVLGVAPAVAAVAIAVRRFGPAAGTARVLPLALLVGVGVLGLTALVLAWLPATLERLGLRRLGAWLRTWWDEDAR